MSVTSIAVQFTIIDLLSRGVDKIRDRMAGLANGNRDVQQSFDRMAKSAKYAAMSGVATYQMAKGLKPAVSTAASLQEATLRVKGNLAGGAKDAADLTAKLREVKKNAIVLSADSPFSAVELVDIENSLLKAGLTLKDVTGKAGAAYAASALASLSGEAPAMVGDSLANIGSMFALEGSQYGELSDWLVKVDDASATSLPALIQGLKMSGSIQDALTTLGALAPLGQRAGSSFNNMLIGMQKMPAFFQEGKFIGMAAAAKLLRKELGGIEDDQKRLNLLLKIFGEEGGRGANTLINAAKGFDEIEEAAHEALGTAGKMDIWAEGFNASLAKLGGSGKSTIAELFQPALAPLTKLTDKANEFVSAIGKAAAEKKSIANAVSGLSFGSVAAGGLATVGLAGRIYAGGWRWWCHGRRGSCCCRQEKWVKGARASGWCAELSACRCIGEDWFCRACRRSAGRGSWLRGHFGDHGSCWSRRAGRLGNRQINQ